MSTVTEITVTHSSRRPDSRAWCASSCGRSTYAESRDAAIEKHRCIMQVYDRIGESLRLCAEYSKREA